MPQILRTTMFRELLVTPADAPVERDLPVNPISVLLLTVEPLNDTLVPGNYSSLAQLLSMIPNVNISYRGANIVNGSLQDLAIMYGCLCQWMPAQSGRNRDDNQRRQLTVPIVLGRRPYDPMECFPATRRGDLTLALTTDTVVVGADGLLLTAETVELLEATPRHFIKVTTTRKPIGATGEDDVELPIGNDMLGILMFSPTAGDPVLSPTINDIRLQIDNVETLYSNTAYDSLHGELYRKLGPWPHQPHTHAVQAHVHTLAAAAGIFPLDAADTALSSVAGVLTVDGAADAIITGVNPSVIADTLEQEESFPLLDGYLFMDFDPLRDGQYALKTAGAARVNLRVNFGGAPPETPRFLPVELVPVPGAPAAGA